MGLIVLSGIHASNKMRCLLQCLVLCLALTGSTYAQEKNSSAKQQKSVSDLQKDVEELKANQKQILKELQDLKQILQTIQTALTTTGSPPPQPVITLNVYGEPFRGNKDAHIAIIEYSDFECPYCGQYAREIYPQIDANYVKAGRVKYYFRDLPLPIHPNAMQAARAARCSGEQGKFWEMHDRLFTHQQALTNNDLLQHAQALDLDVKKFSECLASDKYTENIRRSMISADRSGVNGTPAFFIGLVESNGSVIRASKVVIGLEPFETFKAAIDELLTQSK